VFWRSV
ncbi:hypothetical protein D039_4504B, partial [Vibrio parahaemolyticus EKP-028]